VRQEKLAILEDQSGKLTIEQVASSSLAKKFSCIQDRLPVNSNKNAAYWLRFTVINKSASDKNWLVEIFDHNINYVTFYRKKTNGRFEAEYSGNMLLFRERTFGHKNFEFDLPIATGRTETFFFRIESENKNVIMPEIRSYKRFITYALGEYYILGLFYGVLLMMVIYNLLLFAILRKRVYLYYVFYVTSFAVYSMCENGFSFQYLWPSSPQLNRFASGAAFYSAIIFSLLFTVNFLKLREFFPQIQIVINVVIILRSLVFFTGLFINRDFLSPTHLDIIPLSIAFVAGIFCYFRGDRTSRYFVLAYTLMFISFIISLLERYGLIWSDIFTVYSLNFGILFEIIFLSASMADRMKVEIAMREEAQDRAMLELKEKEFLKDKVNKELEAKVAERTELLRDANERLRLQAEEITRMNLKLDLANRDLRKDVTEISRTRIMGTQVDFSEFVKVYPDTFSCFRYLEELKSRNVFRCKKCGSQNCGKGKELFDRRCTSCGYNESITANTIFHKLKFPILKAFYMMYLVNSRKKITIDELSEILDLRKATCVAFRKKIQERIDYKGKAGMSGWDVLILDSTDNSGGQKKKEKPGVVY
jgi:hypothetical protein